MFHKMTHIMSETELLDSAFLRAKAVKLPYDPKRSKKSAGKLIEKTKVIVFAEALKKHFDKINKMMPSLELLPPFYRDLAEIAVNKDDFKKSLNSVRWADKKIRALGGACRRKMSKTTPEKAIVFRKQFFGRASSVVKDIRKDLVILETSRKKLRRLPRLMPLPTFVLAGAPNAGKSSVLQALTGAKPEIQPYPFTTKGLLLGYIDKQVQLIDTPGLLDRALEERNRIEMQAMLAITHIAEGLVFIFDPTDASGYSFELQAALFRGLKENFGGLNFFVCLNKFDLASKEEISRAQKFFEKEVVFETSVKTDKNISELKIFLKKESRKLRARQAHSEECTRPTPQQGR
ncbi:MAG: 50S ribosome-binding GTPase [Candidatus Aenigmarchaeota archaeon]|nr:50S ribosome-binding GTPase [Candidatus Aenigmarchaeota archaeon]MCK5333056.1 50S ribosome-binding GTPase [Candidatus Aenigmarchaeota archaeon]